MGMLTSKSRILAELAAKAERPVTYDTIGKVTITYKTKEPTREELENAYRNNVAAWIQARNRLRGMSPEQRGQGMSGMARDYSDRTQHRTAESTKGMWLSDDSLILE